MDLSLGHTHTTMRSPISTCQGRHQGRPRHPRQRRRRATEVGVGEVGLSEFEGAFATASSGSSLLPDAEVRPAPLRSALMRLASEKSIVVSPVRLIAVSNEPLRSAFVRLALVKSTVEDRLFSLQNLSFFPPCLTMSYHVLSCLLMKDMIGHDRTLSSILEGIGPMYPAVAS